LLRGKDVQAIEGLKRQGLSIRAISELTGYDRKTVRKYLIVPDGGPAYRRADWPPSKLDAFKPYLNERLAAGVWNARVLIRELRNGATPAATRS
jgi:transposase